MPNLIDIRRRIRSVKSTQQITKAMKMVAASKLRRSQERVIAARPYAGTLEATLSSVAGHLSAPADGSCSTPRARSWGSRSRSRWPSARS